MNDWLFLVIFLFAIILALVLWWWRGAASHNHRQADTATDSKPQQFHAVTIVPGEHACSAVKHIQHHRFLAAEAVTLPLRDCDQAQCTCKYQHHSDRRAGRDRRYPSINMENVEVMQEHRHGKERRNKWLTRSVKSLL